MTGEIGNQVQSYGSLNKVPAAVVQNIRNQMFMVSESIRYLQNQHIAFTPEEAGALKTYKGAWMTAPNSFRPG